MTRATELESRGNVFTPFTGCAQIYHQRRYICAPFGEQVSLAWFSAPLWSAQSRCPPDIVRPAEGVVCPAAAKRGKGQQAALHNSPSQAALATLKRSPASLCEHLRSDKSQSAAFICPQSLSMRPTTLSAECRCCVWVMSRNRQAHVSP